MSYTCVSVCACLTTRECVTVNVCLVCHVTHLYSEEEQIPTHRKPWTKKRTITYLMHTLQTVISNLQPLNDFHLDLDKLNVLNL